MFLVAPKMLELLEKQLIMYRNAGLDDVDGIETLIKQAKVEI
jgi:hypothetical protein